MVKKDTAKENESKARNKRVREDESQPTPVQKTETSLTESSSSTAKTLEPLSLSEESVRAYFESLGGRVTIRAMKEAFKTTIFEHKKIHGDNSGRDMLLDIVKRLTKTVSDPVLGDVLVLKSSVSMTTHS